MTTIDSIEIVNNHVQVRQVIDGQYHRWVIAPGDNYSAQPKAVRDACKKTHTPAVIEAYQASLADTAL